MNAADSYKSLVNIALWIYDDGEHDFEKIVSDMCSGSVADIASDVCGVHRQKQGKNKGQYSEDSLKKIREVVVKAVKEAFKLRGASVPQNNNSQSSTPNPTGGTSNSGGSSNSQTSQSSSNGGGSTPPPTGGTSNSNSGGGSTPPPNGGATPPPPPPNPPSRSEIMKAATAHFAQRAMAARQRLEYKMNAGPGQDATAEAAAYRSALEDFGKIYLRAGEEEKGKAPGSQHFKGNTAAEREATRIREMERTSAWTSKIPGIDFKSLTTDDIIGGIYKKNQNRQSALNEYGNTAEEEYYEKINAPLRATLPDVDETGYRPLNMREMPKQAKFTTPETPSANRKNFRRFVEWVLTSRRYASDGYIKQLWKQKNPDKNLTSTSQADINAVRKAMGLDNVDGAVQEWASLSYSMRDTAEEPKNQRMATRDRLEKLGKVSPLSQSGSIGVFARFRKMQEEQTGLRDVLKDLRNWKTELREEKSKTGGGDQAKIKELSDKIFGGEEFLKEHKQRFRSLKAGIDPDKKSTRESEDEKFVSKATEVATAIRGIIDFATGKFKNNAQVDEKTAKLFNKRNASPDERAAILYNDGESERERNRKISLANGGTGFRFIDSALARGQRWRLKGQTIGAGLSRIFGGGGGGPGGPGGPAARFLGAAFGPIGIAVGLLTGIYATCKGIYAAAQKSIQKTFELAPFNGRLGATKAQYEGHEFQRKVRFAGDTEEERAQLVAAQDDLLNNTMELRAAFAKIGIYLQTVFLKILGKVGKTLNTFTKALQGNFWKNLGRGLWGGVKRTATNLLSGNASFSDYLIPIKALYKGFRDEMEEIAEENERKKQEEAENDKEVKQKQEELNDVRIKQSLTQNEYAAEGDLARKYFETGKVDELLAFQAGYSNPEDAKKALDNESMRADWEDAIAANDIKRGTDFFQGYKGIDGGAPTSASQIAERILNVLENSNAISLKELETQEKELKAAIETAQNTRKEAQPVKDQPIFRAMEKMAQLYAPKGGEKSADDTQYSGAFGASQEKMYGRFAGETQTTWGRKSR